MGSLIILATAVLVKCPHRLCGLPIHNCHLSSLLDIFQNISLTLEDGSLLDEAVHVVLVDELSRVRKSVLANPQAVSSSALGSLSPRDFCWLEVQKKLGFLRD